MDIKKWTEDIIEKLDKKMSVVGPEIEGKMPFISVNGKWNDRSKDAVFAWTNGFMGGIMWMMFKLTGKEYYKQFAESSEKQLDEAFLLYEHLGHDVGFLWIPTSGMNYKLFKNEDSKRRLLYATSLLYSRFNIKGNFIKAWNQCFGYRPEGHYTIIDCMMNISLLYWASNIIGDDRFKHIAIAHADTTIKEHIRDDGSVIHIAVHDPHTAQLITTIGGQGYDENSTWSRGQAWAIYGFIISYIHTKEERYLKIAQKTANYFIVSTCDDYLPKCDFRSPEEPLIYDSSAGAIAACGLLELAKYCNEYDAQKYKKFACKMLMKMEERFCDWTLDEEAILTMATRKYHPGPKISEDHNLPLIFGDYFFIEAIAKLKDEDFMLW